MMRQGEAAKIAMYSLGSNLIFSLALIQPLGAAGLALAGSLAGWVLFFFTVTSFGSKKFFDILIDKKLIILVVVLLVETIVLIWFKEMIHAYL